MLKPRIDKMTLTFVSRSKKKPYNPRVGDKKTVKGVEYVRVYRRYQGAYVVDSNGKNMYDWVKVE